MKNIKFLATALLAMIAINIVLIVFIAIKPQREVPNQPPWDRAGKMVTNELGFDENQQATYEQLRQAHMKATREKMGQKTALKAQLLKSNDDSTAQTIITSMIKLQEEIEWESYRHFNSIKELCREDQLPAYNELVDNMGKRMGRDRQDRHRHDNPKK